MRGGALPPALRTRGVRRVSIDTIIFRVVIMTILDAVGRNPRQSSTRCRAPFVDDRRRICPTVSTIRRRRGVRSTISKFPDSSTIVDGGNARNHTFFACHFPHTLYEYIYIFIWKENDTPKSSHYSQYFTATCPVTLLSQCKTPSARASLVERAKH